MKFIGDDTVAYYFARNVQYNAIAIHPLMTDSAT